MTRGADVRGGLLNYIESQMGWREGKAAEYPEDGRNRRSADALADLMEFVRQLPDDDPRLLAMGDHAHFALPGTDVLSPGEESGRLMSRLGFDGPADLAGFLEEFVASVSRESIAFDAEQAEAND